MILSYGPKGGIENTIPQQKPTMYSKVCYFFLLLSVFVIFILSPQENTSINLTILKDKLFVINHWKYADCK